MASSFPKFADGDVTITVGNKPDLKLHSQKLRDTCDYFSAIPDFHSHFVFIPAQDANLRSPSLTVVPAGNGATVSTSTTAHVARAYTANEVVFRLLYKQPLQGPMSSASFLDIAALAKAYGCVPAVKDALVEFVLGIPALLRIDPWSILAGAYVLEDESLFSEALTYAVGRRGEIDHDGGVCAAGEKLLPNVVAALVAQRAASLEREVQRCWQTVTSCRCRIDTVPCALAEAVLRRFIDKHVACLVGGSALRPDVYRLLKKLHRMDPDGGDADDCEPLLQAGGLLAKAEELGTALLVGAEAVHDAAAREGEEYFRDALRYVDRARGQRVDAQSVESELRAMLRLIRHQIKPLFDGDRGAGYFTCVRFEGPFPWQEDSP